MDNNLKRGFLISLSIHLLLLGSLYLSTQFQSANSSGNPSSNQGQQSSKSQPSPGPTDQPNHSSNQEHGQIIPKEQDKPVEVEIVEGEGIGQAKHASARCRDFFGGIGIQYGPSLSGVVAAVYIDYPAYDAGIRPDDVIVSPGLDEVKGEIGTKVTVTWQNASGRHTAVLIRDKICIQRQP